MLGIGSMVIHGDVVTPALVAVLVAAVTSLASGWARRPKTRAEAGNLNATARVGVSADNREWAELFVQRANAAEARADRAEHRAEDAEHRADEVEHRADELEAGLVACYGYVRQLRDEIRRLDGKVPPLPARLETLWRATGHS
jgi:hypothetical protein